MKFKRIFNKEWLSLHPYTNADSVDLYYVNLANRIKKTILGGIKFNPYKTENSLDELSCMLTAWFEDAPPRSCANTISLSSTTSIASINNSK